MSSDFVAGAIVALLLIGMGYWLGRSKKSPPPEPNILTLKAERRSLLRELRERTEQVAAQDFAERDRYKVRLQEIGADIAALDEELGSPTQRRHKYN